MTVNENYKLICSSQTILCLKEEMKHVTKLKEKFKKQCIQQIDETNYLNLKLNKENESGIKQKIATKQNHDDVKRSNGIKNLIETRAGKINVQYIA